MDQRLPEVRDAASQVAQLQSDMNDIKTLVGELQLERQRVDSVSKLLKADIGRRETPSASTQDIMAFVRHVDALVWRTRPNSVRRDDAVFAKENIEHLAKRISAWEAAIRADRIR